MHYIWLDLGWISSKEQVFAAFAKVLSLPQWCGHNLDALHDCLTEQTAPLLISVTNLENASQPEYGQCLLRMLRDCVEENPKLYLSII